MNTNSSNTGEGVTIDSCKQYALQMEVEFPVSDGKIGAWLTVCDWCVQNGMNIHDHAEKSAIEKVIIFLTSQKVSASGVCEDGKTTYTVKDDVVTIGFKYDLASTSSGEGVGEQSAEEIDVDQLIKNQLEFVHDVVRCREFDLGFITGGLEMWNKAEEQFRNQPSAASLPVQSAGVWRNAIDNDFPKVKGYYITRYPTLDEKHFIVKEEVFNPKYENLKDKWKSFRYQWLDETPLSLPVEGVSAGVYSKDHMEKAIRFGFSQHENNGVLYTQEVKDFYTSLNQ